MLSTPPRPRRWNCSEVGAFCGTTPQKPAGSACAAEADTAKKVIEASVSVRARRILLMYSLLFDIGSARLGRDGRAGALAALPVVVGADRNRREDCDRNQDRDQGRRGTVFFGAGGVFAEVDDRIRDGDGGRGEPVFFGAGGFFAEVDDRLGFPDGAPCILRAASRLPAAAGGGLVTLAGVGAAARVRTAAARAIFAGLVRHARVSTATAAPAVVMTTAAWGTFFRGHGWYFRFVLRPRRFFGVSQGR